MDVGTINQWASLIANLGVLIGIIFLAMELRQNTKNLAAQARATYFSSLADTFRIPAENISLTEAMAKDQSGKELTQAERWQVMAFWTRVQTTVEWGYKELPRSEFLHSLPFQKITYDMMPLYRASWQERESLFDPTFYGFMMKNVFDKGDLENNLDKND
ncbi:hypothetical protein [Robiginitalea sp. SC105]|uniref:hypothetical protein n=1 Tax=Robiginitalea sp. SC105 TaxID=2762332 RepID=UPI00163A203B|nr:hypothetical protein [Robiginitalea sp. SC105]MBC2839853.1 hypothetical protein [Robiginitalea sp. SC105]